MAKEGDNTANEYEVKEAKFYDIIKDGNITASMFENILPASIPSGMQGRVIQNAPSNEGTAAADTENVSPANIPKGMQGQVRGSVPYNVEGTPAIVIPQTGMQNGSVPSTISVAQLLAGVKDREWQAFK